MQSQAALSDDLSEDAPVGDRDDWARPLIERQLAVLSDLAEAALAVSLTLQRKITAVASDDVSGDVESLTLAFTRAARAVRLSVALQSRLIEQRQQWARDEADEDSSLSVSRRAAREGAQEAVKTRVENAVWRVAAADADNDDETLDRLAAEAREKLDDEDVFGDVLARPVSETIALICEDLGLAPDWPRLAEEAWAQREMQGGRVGAPLAGLAGAPWEPLSLDGRGAGVRVAAEPAIVPRPPP